MKTTSFEISKKLAEIGFEAETEIYWIEFSKHRKNLTYVKFEVGTFRPEWKYIKAYDLETILEALPEAVNGIRLLMEFARGRRIGYKEGSDQEQIICFKKGDESFADTAARLLLKLHEKGIINFNKSDEVKNV